MGSFSKKREFTVDTEAVAFQAEHRTRKLKEGGAPGHVRKESKQGWAVTGHRKWKSLSLTHVLASQPLGREARSLTRRVLGPALRGLHLRQPHGTTEGARPEMSAKGQTPASSAWIWRCRGGGWSPARGYSYFLPLSAPVPGNAVVLCLRWLGYARTGVSPPRFLRRASLRWVPTALGLDAGHLPLGSPRTRLPLQARSTGAQSRGDARDVQGGPRRGLRGRLGQAVGRGKAVRRGAKASG